MADAKKFFAIQPTVVGVSDQLRRTSHIWAVPSWRAAGDAGIAAT